MLLDINEKLTYLINICEPDHLNNEHINYLSESQIGNLQSFPYCTRLAYELFINGYQHFIASNNYAEAAFEKINGSIKLVKSGFSKSFIITIGLLLFSLMTIVILSIRIRKFKTHLYSKLLLLPKAVLTDRILSINRFAEINNNNNDVKMEVARLSKEGADKRVSDKDYSLLIERKKFTASLSYIELATIFTLCWLIVILLIMLLLYLHITNKFVSSLEITQCYIDIRTNISEASLLYYMSCTNSKPTYIESQRTVVEMIGNAKRLIKKLRSYKYYPAYKEFLDEGVCSMLTDKNSKYFTPYINAVECASIYHGSFNKSMSDAIEFYILSIDDSYRMLLQSGACEMDEHYEEIFKLSAHYLNPATIAQISWAVASLSSREKVFTTLIWGYNIFLLVVISFLISLIAFISRDIQNTTHSVKKVLSQITKKRF